jgi:7-cyano-7-deazaguanine synthase
MKKTNYDLVILFSGGADSIMLGDLASQMNKKPLYLMIDYGQLHKQELTYAVDFLTKQNQIQHSQTIKIENLSIDSGLTGDGVQESYEDVNSFYVPSRNLMFISIAASIAENNGIDTIWYGANYSDRINIFPDCYQEWVVKVNKLLELNGSKKIKLEAPLLGLTKESVLAYLDGRGYNMDKIFSGYGDLEK